MINAPPTNCAGPYQGTVVVHRLSWDDLAKVCGGAYPKILACSKVTASSCIKFMPKIGPGGVSPPLYAIIDQHENGHCVCPTWVHK